MPPSEEKGAYRFANVGSLFLLITLYQNPLSTEVARGGGHMCRPHLLVYYRDRLR